MLALMMMIRRESHMSRVWGSYGKKKRKKKDRTRSARSVMKVKDKDDECVKIRKANLLMLIHERNNLIQEKNNNLFNYDFRISELTSEMSEAGKCDIPDLMFGCRVCQDMGMTWLGKNAQVLTTHFNATHRIVVGEYNIIEHQYHERDKSKISEWLTSKKYAGAKPKTSVKTPLSKGKKPVVEVEESDKTTGPVEDSISRSASGHTPNNSQESQLSSQTFSPGATSTRNQSGIDSTITVSSGDSSASSADSSVKIVQDKGPIVATGRGKKHGLDRTNDDSDDDDDDYKKQKLSDDEINKFSFDQLHKGLKNANLMDSEAKARQAAIIGGEVGETGNHDETLMMGMNDTFDDICFNVLGDKGPFNEETIGEASQSLLDQGAGTKAQDELYTEMQGQLRGKEAQVEGMRIQLEEKESQVHELKSIVKKKELVIEQLVEKSRKHEELNEMLVRLGVKPGEDQGAMLKRMCEELARRKAENTKLKAEIQSETKEKNKLRSMYETATEHVTMLTGVNKQKEVEVKEIRRNMVCPQLKEGGWCQLPTGQCDYKHPPPKSEQECRWNYPKHAAKKPQRCKKADCEYRHDPNIQNKTDEGRGEASGGNDVHMKTPEEQEDAKEEAEKKRKIEERRKKRAQRKMKKNMEKGTGGTGSNNVTNPNPPKNNTRKVPHRGTNYPNSFQSVYTHPPPQLPTPHQSLPAPIMPIVQQQPNMQLQQPVMQQQIPVLPILQPRYGPVPQQEHNQLANLPQPVPILGPQQMNQQQGQNVREVFTTGQLDRVVNDSSNQGNTGFEINWSNGPPPFPTAEGRVKVQHPPSGSNHANNQAGVEQGLPTAVPSYNSQRIQIRQEIEKEQELYRRQKEETERLQQQNAMRREMESKMLYQQQLNQVQEIQDVARQYLPNQQQYQTMMQQPQYQSQQQQPRRGPYM